MSCNLCGLTEYKILYPATLKADEICHYSITDNEIGQHGEIVQCKNCGLVFVSDKNYIEQILNLYKNQPPDQEYLKEEKGRRKTAIRVLKNIERLAGRGKLLDLGCSCGIFLDEARKRGFEVFGIEPSSEAVKKAKEKYNLSIFHSSLEEKLPTFPDEYFDSIVMIDVLEHLKDPLGSLNLIARKLKKEGLLVIVTPNIGSFLAKIQKESWYAILPSHLFYFNFSNLSKLFSRYKFKIVKKKTHHRYFSLNYLNFRKKSFSPGFYSVLNFIFKITKLGRLTIPVNFFDQIEIYSAR